jgi:signal transduction histidine kinase
LYTVQRIVAASGGKLELSSSQGGGTVRVQLPRRVA